MKDDIKPFLVCTIDVGAHAARMLIAQVSGRKKIEVLEDLEQPVPIGSDVFKTGRISAKAVRVLCGIFRNFRMKMDEYGVTICKAVATSAVREASNAEIFLERIEHASGIKLQIFEGIDGARLDYLTVNRFVKKDYKFDSRKILIADIGTGACQISAYDNGEISFTETIRTGTLRVLEEMAATISSAAVISLLAPFVKKVFGQLYHISHDLKADGIVAMGSSVRALARLAGPPKKGTMIMSISREKFDAISKECVKKDVGKLSEEYNLSPEIAQAVAPCCLIIDYLFRATGAKELIVPMTSTKDALLHDFIYELLGKGEDYFIPQITAAVKNMARKYRCLDDYTEAVVRYSRELFSGLEALHGLSQKDGLLLSFAAYLHKCGLFINNQGYHKHSYYLISSSEIPGISRNQLQIAALAARYHRRSMPKPAHVEYMSLSREARITVCKMAALLRLACGMAEAYDGYKKFSVAIEEDSLMLEFRENTGKIFDTKTIQKASDLFTYVFSRTLTVS
ncbi:MAG: hypothetical protein A2020_06775 [Lentisphaerae bacterium GWF2_45_14]|nr:MAG: hypothetical protein A2020_06775 [Lentisphaerae bacterium GWF2_45_14]